MAGAGGCYVGAYGVSPGQRVVMATNNDSAYDVAKLLCAANINLPLLLDSREQLPLDKKQELEALGVEVVANGKLYGVEGGRSIKRVISSHGKMDADTVLSSAGWSPALQLLSQAGGSMKWDEELAAFIPDQLPDNVTCVGSCAGQFALEACLDQGFSAGQLAAQALGFQGSAGDAPLAQPSQSKSQSQRRKRKRLKFHRKKNSKK